jgi:putative flavoprotein involved in K+ transport
MKYTDTVVVGGGQAGLAISYYLSQQSRDHVVLEQAAQAANAWRNDRWDSFTLVTPNWTVQMPGAAYSGADPHGFMTREDLVAYFEQYIQRFKVPMQYSTRVESIERSGGKYEVHTSAGLIEAGNVVMATGLFQKPKIPAFSTEIPQHVLQLHSGQYRNPSALPDGAVLVVGSAQSGCQIAEELYQAGRKVYLSVGTTGRAPRRYRGKDCFEWLNLVGFLSRTPDKLPSPKARFAGNPQVSGKDGGHSLNLYQFAHHGVKLLGRIEGVNGHKLGFAADLEQSLAKADGLEEQICKMVDNYIVDNGLEIPQETLPQLRNGYSAEAITELDLEAAGIGSIIWATGYSFDFSLVKLPITDGDGYPLQQRGVTQYPGLYFLGLPWLHTQKSGLLLGVGEDAAHLATVMAKG